MAKYYHGLIFKNSSERERFVKTARDRMDAMGIDVPALARQTGYNRKSVYQFFKDEHIANKFLAASIADALRIGKSDWA